MDTRKLRRYVVRWALVIAGAVALILAGLELSERETSEDAVAAKHEPAIVEPVRGTALKRVKLSASAAERLGLQTVPVRRRTVPYSAVLYDEHGKTWVYTSPRRLTFIRAAVEIKDIRGDVAAFSAGPRAGTQVVTVGAAELYGAELGVDH